MKLTAKLEEYLAKNVPHRFFCCNSFKEELAHSSIPTTYSVIVVNLLLEA